VVLRGSVGHVQQHRRSHVRFGNDIEVRPLGGGLGCLAMVLFSIVASVVLTILVNLVR
jgi:hypothetical protein